MICNWKRSIIGTGSVDWWYDYSDGHGVWQRGNEREKELSRMDSDHLADQVR